MDSTAPEIGAVEVFLGFIPEQLLHVLADECRRIVAGSPEAVDYGRGAREQMLDTLACRRRCLFRALAFGYVAPRTHYLGRLAYFIADQALRVVDPAVGAVLFQEPVLDRMAAFLEQHNRLSFHCSQI